MNKHKENWIAIDNYNGYHVSDYGRVYSEKSKRCLKGNMNISGYFVVELRKNNKGKKFYVHRIVMLNFSKEKQQETVNHIDGNKENNQLSNLEWLSYSENLMHARRTGLIKRESAYIKGIPVEKRDLNGNLLKTYKSFYQARKETGVNTGCIRLAIDNGWEYGGYVWTLPI